MGIQVQKCDTLWGIAKQSVQAQNGEGQKVTNQQIVDEMNKIAKANGYDNIDDCVKDNFYAKNGKLGSLSVKGLEVERAEESSEGAPGTAGAADEASVETNPADTEQALEYTTLGAMGTLGTKTVLKSAATIIKDKKVREGAAKLQKQAKKAATKVKCNVAAEKVKRARNGQAAKMRDARKAAEANKAAKNTLKAEQAKLRSLKANKASADAIKAQEKVVAKAKANSVKATETMKAKRKAAGLNKTTGQPLKNKKIVKTRNSKVAVASAKKAVLKKTAAKSVTKKAATKVTAKATAKALMKAGGKTILKKIPGVGLIAGIAFAVDRASHGDWLGATGEVLSGVASCVPGVGTAISTAIDVGLAAKDVYNAR